MFLRVTCMTTFLVALGQTSELARFEGVPKVFEADLAYPQYQQPYVVFKANMSDVHFLLWTRDNPGNYSYYELIFDDVDNLKASPFDAQRPTVIVAHGWNADGHGDWIFDAKIELLKYEDCNFISIDWGKIADHIDYFAVVNNVPKVASHSAQFLDFLHTEGGLNITSLYAAGHSVGAHLIGIMGSSVVNGPLGRITGLDPAGPDYYGKPEDIKLDKSDAIFVDTIHSNSGPLLDFCVGLAPAFGHVDFYPNGGRHQPDCTIGGDWEELLTAGCSHKRSHDLWIESINGETQFKSWPCPDWETYQAGGCTDCGTGCLDMGMHANTQLKGTYYLETNAEPPYARG